MLFDLPGALENLRGLSHVLVNGLPGAVLLPVCPVLPDVQPARLRQHTRA